MTTLDGSLIEPSNLASSCSAASSCALTPVAAPAETSHSTAQTSAPNISVQFVRTPMIWLYYALIGLNCYVISALGPIMPFLRGELKLSYQVAGYHFSAFAVGTVLAGLTGDNVLLSLGKYRALCLSIVGTICGITTFITGHSAYVTIVGIALCGYCTSLTYQILASVISNHLGDLRTFAFVEAEVVAMLGAMVAPFAVSAFVFLMMGWRGALIALALLFACTVFGLKKFNTVEPIQEKAQITEGRLTRTFWSYATVILLSVSAEWSVAFWSADYLHERLLVTKTDAAAAVGAFFVGMVLGRLGGARLVRRFTPASMLIVSGGTAIAGFFLFWLSTNVFLSVVGLLLTGLGIANMYPLSFSKAVASAASQASSAIARVSLVCGSALLLAPLCLSFVAEKTGLFGAFSMVAVILLLCGISIFYANHVAAKSEVVS